MAVAGILFTSCGTGKKLEAANAQIAGMSKSIDSLNKVVADGKQDISQLKTENIQYSKEAEDCRKLKEAYAAKVEKFNKTLEANGSSMEEIKAKIAKSLATFKDAGITVKYKDGLVYVSMEDQLMFPSGSIKLQDQGRQALSVIADAMHEFKHLTVYVVGNTDTVTVAKTYKDNWSLSTERANVVVRVLRDYYGADPHRLVAAGKGKYDPVESNDTAEGRSKNRRIDIVLNPDLSKLVGMMVKDQ